jgi:hypothetical protein
MTNNELDFDLLQLVSHHFLTSPLPDNWFDMDESTQNQFILDHIWQPIEYYDAQFVWDCIESAALHTQNFIRDRLNKHST